MRFWMPGRPGRAMTAGDPVRQAECSPANDKGSIRVGDDRGGRCARRRVPTCECRRVRRPSVAARPGRSWLPGGAVGLVPRGGDSGTYAPAPPACPGWHDGRMFETPVAPDAPSRRSGRGDWVGFVVRDAVFGDAAARLVDARLAVPLVLALTAIYVATCALLPSADIAVPFAIVPLGHPAESKPPSDRYDEARVHRERW